MGKEHLHADIIDITLVTLMALIGFNVIRLGSAYLVQKGGTLGKAGETLGALVHFGG